jgi:hypothetical protein
MTNEFEIVETRVEEGVDLGFRIKGVFTSECGVTWGIHLSLHVSVICQ